MWYTILPPLGIIGVLIGLPYPLVGILNKLTLGQSYRRTLYDNFDCYMYLRDMRVGKKESAYAFAGLDNIMDDVPPPPPVEEEEEELVCYRRKKPAA